MKKYDLILIEPEHNKKAHYENIQRHIAEILTGGGLKVAIVNYLPDNEYHINRKYDVINIDINLLEPPIIWREIEGETTIKRSISEYKLSKIKKNYFEKLISRIDTLSDSIYIGTISQWVLPILTIKALKRKKVFLWCGTYWAMFSRIGNLKKPINFIKPILLKHIIKNKNIVIFAGNQPIKDVLIKKGINENNIIIKPERSFNPSNIAENRSSDDEFSLATIGAIRQQKNIEFALDALKGKRIIYIVSGESKKQYAFEINDLMSKMDNRYFIRINKRFSEDEYNSIIRESHFILICDKEYPYPGSNGVLFDAVYNMRPVIVPDHSQFRYYIDKYKIGLKYKPNDKDSLLKTIYKAKELGDEYFHDNIKKFRKEHNHSKIVKEFTKEVRNCLHNHI